MSSGDARVLTGVGVGPGDPELLTLKGLRVLREADLVVVPVLGAEDTGRAEATVRAHVPAGRVRRAVFALNERADRSRRERYWDAAARQVADGFAAGAARIAFATIGDPNVYSTFSYLAQGVRALVPAVEVRTVPGITAMQDLAARSGTVLAEGTESLSLLPLTGGTEGLRAALTTGDTVVAYKFGQVAGEVLAAVAEAGRLDDAVYGARLGLPGEDVRRAAEITGPVPYLSTLIVPGRRGGLGGKLSAKERS
jgi:precorrin-2/cobalt-factor-2 C20-methyltransferase